MLTLGIDLASQAENTATCEIQWADGQAVPLPPVRGNTDRDLVAQVGRCNVIGIDAPFGWPEPFVELVALEHPLDATWPEWTPEYTRTLRFRQTDFRVRDVLGRWPLSVSSDMIAVTALRCAGLLAKLGVVDRSGDGRVFEVYPAVALAAWGFRSRGYKGIAGEQNRKCLIQALAKACPWLHLSDEVTLACQRSDHAFDALIASLVARAAAMGETTRPTVRESELARREGWIAIPHGDSLGKLVFPPSDNR